MQTGDLDYTKITVKIFKPLFDSFEKRVRKLFIKRDEFVDHLISVELDYLAEDVKNLRQSDAARRYISKTLKRMGTKTVNIVVKKETALKVKLICDEANIVRDAFVNRLLLLVIARNSFLDYVDLPANLDPAIFERYEISDIATTPFGAIEQIYNDPFYYLRIAAKTQHDMGLYMLAAEDEKLHGLACYLPDLYVPGTADYLNAQEEASRLLGLLDGLGDEEVGS